MTEQDLELNTLTTHFNDNTSHNYVVISITILLLRFTVLDKKKFAANHGKNMFLKS